MRQRRPAHPFFLVLHSCLVEREKDIRKMEFRPCIDIHNGKVKQIIGGTLRDEGDQAAENFVSEKNAAWYAGLYRRLGLPNGHIILLNPPSSGYYAETLAQAREALAAWPGHMQIGGGIGAENAASFLDAGAGHVIVTSYVFREGRVDWEALERLRKAVGKEHLVLDLSCRKRDGGYWIVTDRWQKFTDVEVTAETLRQFASFCDEFLVHAADAEGKAAGAERPLIRLLADHAGIPVTYAGGIGSYEELQWIRDAGGNRLHVTIGSALDLFGGALDFRKVLEICATPAQTPQSSRERHSADR